MASQDRIGSACWYLNEKTNKWRSGKVLTWTVQDHIHGRRTPAAILEDDKTGVSKVIPVDGNICWLSNPPGPVER